MDRPLLVTDDAELLEDVLRIAATAAVEVQVCAHAEAARLPWQSAPLILVGSDLLPAVSRLELQRRRDVVVVTRILEGPIQPPQELWPLALALGAEHVVALPEAERWLISRLRSIHEGPSRNGQILAVIGACGGAGSSTLAAGLAHAAHTSGQRVLLIDTDMMSGGIDLILGADAAPGVRWSDLTDVSGRLSAQSLEQALPKVEGVVVAAPHRHLPSHIAPEVFAAVLDAGIRGFDVVVIDLPRTLQPVHDHVLAAADRTLLVVPTRVIATCAAGVMLQQLRSRTANVELVVRELRAGLAPDVVSEALEMPIAQVIASSSRVAEAADNGDLPTSDEGFARSCAALLPPVSKTAAA
jgi:secretion/DNA translocation related CpaE-like protein